MTSALSEEVMWSKEPPEKVKQKETPTLATCNLPWGPLEAVDKAGLHMLWWAQYFTCCCAQ